MRDTLMAQKLKGKPLGRPWEIHFQLLDAMPEATAVILCLRGKRHEDRKPKGEKNSSSAGEVVPLANRSEKWSSFVVLSTA
ncbi:Intercellular Adhesion Molecule 3 [Manis pentadactyla]|nr:Intercellular Adhesion Molecule 3 [Manis pentadactyla]